MKKLVLSLFVVFLSCLSAYSQEQAKKLYDESIDPVEQINAAVERASAIDKFVICQVGGNWCPWCVRFANFITSDDDIAKVVNDNFVYIHVNYNPRKGDASGLGTRLNNCFRFGFPVLVVLDGEGKVIHIQDSSFLEEDKGYNKEKVLRFFNNWIPAAVYKQ